MYTSLQDIIGQDMKLFDTGEIPVTASGRFAITFVNKLKVPENLEKYPKKGLQKIVKASDEVAASLKVSFRNYSFWSIFYSSMSLFVIIVQDDANALPFVYSHLPRFTSYCVIINFAIIPYNCVTQNVVRKEKHEIVSKYVCK